MTYPLRVSIYWGGRAGTKRSQQQITTQSAQPGRVVQLQVKLERQKSGGWGMQRETCGSAGNATTGD